MKKALMLASVASMIEQFNMENIKLLKVHGYEVDVITNFEYGSTMPQEKVDSLRVNLKAESVSPIHVPIPRKIFDIKGIINSYRIVKKECENKKYEIIHCHSPIGGVIARLAARKSRNKNGTKVIYTAHGFHFCKGASIKNWLIFFPIEWFCSFFTDILITINREDYDLARKHIHAKEIKYVPGVGINSTKIGEITISRNEKRAELGIRDNEFAVISVGELNDNKNHETVIRALSKLNDKNIAYIVCGKGDKKAYLENLANELGVNLILPGFRNDIAEIYKSCDLFAFPSKREGLSVALMEAMAAGLPAVCSNIRGNVDLVKDCLGGYLVSPANTDDMAEKIRRLVQDRGLCLKMGQYNKNAVLSFDIEYVQKIMREIYSVKEVAENEKTAYPHS